MGLFQTVLKDRFELLPAPVRAVHGGAGKRSFSGRVTVLALSPVTGYIAAFVTRLPRKAEEFPITAILELADGAERWTRIMGGQKFSSVMRPAADYTVREYLAGSACEFFLAAGEQGIDWHLRHYRLLGIALPKILWPRVRGREFVDGEGRYNFDVEVIVPVIGRVLGYRGWLTPAS